MDGSVSFYATKEWHKIRTKALIRDNYTCTVCKRPKGAGYRLHVDHILPLKQRPDLALTLENLRVLCQSCDNKRHVEKAKEFVQETGPDGFPISANDAWYSHK